VSLVRLGGYRLASVDSLSRLLQRCEHAVDIRLNSSGNSASVQPIVFTWCRSTVVAFSTQSSQYNFFGLAFRKSYTFCGLFTRSRSLAKHSSYRQPPPAGGPVDDIRLLFPYAASMSRYDRPSHRVFMTFFFRRGWQVQFCETDLKTPLPRTFTFADPEKIRELARRGEAWGDSESRQMLEYGIENGRGGTYLKLTPGQYAKLRR
jgi:hypothetical protein